MNVKVLLEILKLLVHAYMNLFVANRTWCADGWVSETLPHHCSTLFFPSLHPLDLCQGWLRIINSSSSVIVHVRIKLIGAKPPPRESAEKNALSVCTYVCTSVHVVRPASPRGPQCSAFS